MLAYRGQLDPDMPLDETIGALGGTFRYPFRYGYSAVGFVEQSRGSLPEGTQVFAFHPHQDRFSIDTQELVPLDGVASREASLFPLVETAFQITLDTGLRPEQRTMVIGLGPVGALTSVLLARLGVEVLGVDPLSWRRSAVAGLDIPGLSALDPEAVDVSSPHWEPVPVVVEASGNPDAIGLGLTSLAHEGTLLVASWFGNRKVSLPLGEDFHRRRLTIASTQVSTIPERLAPQWDKDKRRQAVVELMRDLPLSVFATHTFPFENAEDAYDAIDRRQEGLIHAALEYE
jgi:threonine dehydrogenase-like Zn-dependent dehydrogenase